MLYIAVWFCVRVHKCSVERADLFSYQIKIQIQITLFFPEIVHNNYMGIYKMNQRIQTSNMLLNPFAFLSADKHV